MIFEVSIDWENEISAELAESLVELSFEKITFLCNILLVAYFLIHLIFRENFKREKLVY